MTLFPLLLHSNLVQSMFKHTKISVINVFKDQVFTYRLCIAVIVSLFKHTKSQTYNIIAFYDLSLFKLIFLSIKS